jgi:putative nucleotidyltransferase with HDIG domain
MWPVLMGSTLAELQRRTIESLESRLEQIAMLPSVIAHLAALDLDSPTATDEIVALIRSDPPLALRLLRLANYRSSDGDGIDTIPGAILEVGAHNLANLILALSVVEVFVPHTRAQRNLWIHSIQTAMAARRLAVLRPDMRLGMEQCFLAGLLHDIGRFVIFEHRPEEMAQIDEANVADPRQLVAAELEACGFDHAALGHEVCRRWRLPETVSEMVRVHHMYGEARRRIPPEVAGLVRLVQEADCVSFGLLRNLTSSFPSAADRNRSIAASLPPLSSSERILPPAQLAEELVNIDREARMAAAVIHIAYS